EVPTRDGRHAARAARLGPDILLRMAPAPAAAAPALRAAAPAAAPAPAIPATTGGAPPSTLDAFAGAAPFGAALLDGPDVFTARIVGVNETMARMSEGLAASGRLFAALLDPATLDEVRQRLAARPSGPVEVRLGLQAPRTAHLYLTPGGGRLVAYLLDVSEQKQLELQLAQSQKMQAIGQLAGGVAHDFNNLLTAIQLRLDELLHRHPVGDPSYEGLNEIRQTGVRAADLVRKLLAFSRKQTVQRETLELGSLMSEFEVLLRRLLREDVRLLTDYGRDPPLVRADRAALETAVMNLAVNARDALRSHPPTDGGPGVVRIRTARLSQADAAQLGFPAAPPEGAALIEVADNGPGIAPDVAEKIFEPFFTTKPVGEGTGLGLATVYGIVKQADGWIHVEPGVGRGAAFRVFLPIHTPAPREAAPAPAPAAVAPAKPKPARDLSGAGRILFVEDEDAVRVVAARLLRARGYEVIEAADGEEALELAEAHTGQIDLLISDVIMPGLDGPTLLKKARRFLDGAKVMFISGYAEAEFSDLLEGEEGVTFLPKPIDIKILAERVKQQLQAA
ncbi:MAG: response regulator, partial [Caulobacteraceae bacterium]|nr:response regulator [Caulobacter sp.]